jgi:thymidylate synthase
LLDIFNEGEEITVRGKNVTELLNYSFTLTNPRNRLLNIHGRNEKMRRYIFGELMWYLSGSDKTDYISKYSKFWKNISDDGKHANSAYGKYIFGSMSRKGDGVNYCAIFDHCERYTQWEWCKELLQNDPNTREAVINIKPVQMYDTKDVVCTLALNFYLRNNKLYLTTYMRSNDVIKGLTYDVFMFTFLQELMAAELNVELGEYNHVVTNMHLYEDDYELAKNISKELRVFKPGLYSLACVPNDFRTNDLPLLLDYEEHGFVNAGLDEFEKLSTIGWQLLSFLEDSNYVREQIQKRI